MSQDGYEEALENAERSIAEAREYSSSAALEAALLEIAKAILLLRGEVQEPER